MEPLMLFIICLLTAIGALPFVARAKANSAKRDLDDLTARLSSLENEVRNLGQRPVLAPEPEASAPAPKAFGVPPPLPVSTPTAVVSETTPEPLPIPQEQLEPTAPQIARPA